MAFRRKFKKFIKKRSNKDKMKRTNFVSSKGQHRANLWQKQGVVFPPKMKMILHNVQNITGFGPTAAGTSTAVYMKQYANTLNTLTFYNIGGSANNPGYDLSGQGQFAGYPAIANQYTVFRIYGAKYKMTFTNTTASTYIIWVAPFGPSDPTINPGGVKTWEHNYVKKLILQPVASGSRNSGSINMWVSGGKAGVDLLELKSSGGFEGTFSTAGASSTTDPAARFGLIVHYQLFNGGVITDAAPFNINIERFAYCQFSEPLDLVRTS